VSINIIVSAYKEVEMKITIDDVAKDSGVSTATVSRYLNNSPKISEKSKKKVRKSMEKLNYMPNFLAQSLAGVITHTIAFVIDSTNEKTYGNEFFAKIQFGVERELSKQGFYMLVISIEDVKQGTKTLHKMIMEKRIEGVILPIELASSSITEFLKDIDFPFAIIGQHDDPEIICADINNLQGAFLATQTLIEKGSRKILYVSPEYNKDSLLNSRFTGYKKALEKNNIPLNLNLVELSCNSFEIAKTLGKEIIDQKKDIDGIVCTDNKIAFTLVQYLTKAGTKIPEELQVICFDNTDLTIISEPSISVVDIDVVILGQVLARKVLGGFNSEEKLNSMELINAGLTLRQTTRK